MVEKTRVNGPPFGERAEPQERKEREGFMGLRKRFPPKANTKRF